MSGIDLYLDFNGERLRISGAKLRTQADADELIAAISIVRRLLPGATEKAPATAPEGEHRPVSPSTITEAPKPLPDPHDDRPAEAKTSDQEPSVSDGSGGMQDESAIHPATHSPAKAPRSEEGRTTGKSTRAKAFVAPPGEQNERTMKRLEVAALHDAEPWLTPDEAAMRLFIPVVNLRIFSQELEIEWSQKRRAEPTPAAKEKSPSLLSRVRKMHEQHPQWPAHIIASRLGGPVATVKRYLTAIREERKDAGSAEQARAA